MISINTTSFDPRDVSLVRALAKDAKGDDRVDVVLKSGFLFTFTQPSFEAAEGLQRNIINQIRPYHPS